MSRIYHITSAAGWYDAQNVGKYTPPSFDERPRVANSSSRQRSCRSGRATWRKGTREFAEEQFIHCSYSHQLLTVAHKFYRGQSGLVILVIESSKINSSLIEENLEGGIELYPHLYGVLPIKAVVKAIAFPCNADGSFDLPKELNV